MDPHHPSALSPGQVQSLHLCFGSLPRLNHESTRYQGQNPAAQTPRTATSPRRHSVSHKRAGGHLRAFSSEALLNFEGKHTNPGCHPPLHWKPPSALHRVFFTPGSPTFWGHFTPRTSPPSAAAWAAHGWGHQPAGAGRPQRCAFPDTLSFSEFQAPKLSLGLRQPQELPRSQPAPGLPQRQDARGCPSSSSPLLPVLSPCQHGTGASPGKSPLAPKPFPGQLEGCFSAFPPLWRVSRYEIMKKKKPGKNKVRESNSPQNNTVI